MATIISMIIGHLYGDFLCMYIWSKILGRKYSKEFTAVVTFVLCITRLVIKMISFITEGLYIVIFSSSYAYVAYIFYILIMFQSSKGKRLGIMTLTSIITIIMDVLASVFWIKVTGKFEFMQLESTYTISYVIVGNIFITIGLSAMYWCLKKIETIRWVSDWYLWLSILLPISQWFFLMVCGVKYFTIGEGLPALLIIGLILGFLADGYMFVLFWHSNKRRRSENELNNMKLQYELERMRYEQLKANQEEISKIRHDFQNYLLIIKDVR